MRNPIIEKDIKEQKTEQNQKIQTKKTTTSRTECKLNKKANKNKLHQIKQKNKQT